MVRQALADGPLPDDHNGAALWWRIAGRLAPAVAAHVENDHHLNTAWTPRLADLIGPDQAGAVRQSPWWPTLVAALAHDGKQVLYVTSQRRSLRELQDRLASVGLDDLVLDLPGAGEDRRAVTSELGQALARLATLDDPDLAGLGSLGGFALRSRLGLLRRIGLRH